MTFLYNWLLPFFGQPTFSLYGRRWIFCHCCPIIRVFSASWNFERDTGFILFVNSLAGEWTLKQTMKNLFRKEIPSAWAPMLIPTIHLPPAWLVSLTISDSCACACRYIAWSCPPIGSPKLLHDNIKSNILEIQYIVRPLATFYSIK